MNVSTAMIEPVVALIAWSMLMLVWMYATRLPAIFAANMKMDPNAPRGEQMAQLPARVRWKADNFMHLMEQPTVFYALAFALILLGQGEGINVTLAWCYVALRVIHSLVQVTVNKIELRFALFILSNIPLFALTVNAVLALR